KNRRKIISDEHLAIRNEYLNNATPISTYMEGLAGWWTGDRDKMWNKLLVEKKEPTEVIDSIKALVDSSLKRTIG
ncbi:MAG: hypothetical protein RR177_05945, partial [Oscillospiraceae bacterium]